MVLEAPREKVEFEIFNVGGINCTKRNIAENILDRLPKRQVWWHAAKSEDRRNYRVDFNKIRNRLGFEPEWTVDLGIHELVLALKRHKFSDYDRRINFYRNNEISYSLPA